MRVVLPCAKLGVMVPTVFAAYAVVRLEGLIALFCAIYALDTTIMLELTLSSLAEQAVRSEELLHSLRRLMMRSKSLMAKEVAAIRPIVITVGKAYVVDKALVLTVLEIIATNTADMLLLQ